MTMTTHHINDVTFDPTVRHDFVLVYEAELANPNGDPDADNRPRVDSRGRGIVTDACVKRKIRDHVHREHGDQDGFGVFVARGSYLNDTLAAVDDEVGTGKQGTRREMVRRFFDVRMFGAVMSTKAKKSGAVSENHHGPVQIGIGRSVCPVEILDLSVGRVAMTDRADDKSQAQDGSHGTFGDKSVVEHGVYVQTGSYSPSRAYLPGTAQDGSASKDMTVSAEDLRVLFEAAMNMFQDDAAAGRTGMRLRQLVVFSHSSSLGNAFDWQLHDMVTVRPADGVSDPAEWSDYVVTVDLDEDLLAARGITCATAV